MPVRSRNDAVTALKIREGVIVELVHEAFKEVYDHLGPIMFHLEGWTKAGVIRDVAKEKLRLFADIDPGLEMVRKGNATSLRIDNAFTARLKKLDDKKRARVAKTRASMSFDTNSGEQWALDLQDSPLTNSYLGYVINENNPLEPSVYFVVNDEAGKHAWEPIELVGHKKPEAILLPETQPSTEEPQESSRARIKGGAAKDKKTG